MEAWQPEILDVSAVVSQQPRALDCPLCKSTQIQVCSDSNNHMKDFAKCRECHCSAPLFAWNNLVMREEKK
jgi:transcription elongation factor Elf1